MAQESSIDALFDRKVPQVRALYDQLVETLRNFGSFTVVPKHTYILLKKQSNFAGVYPRKDYFNLEFLVHYPLADPRIVKELRLSAHRFAYTVKIETAADLDSLVLKWLKDAYEACK